MEGIQAAAASLWDMLTIAQARAELWRYVLPTPVGGSGVASVDLVTVVVTATDGASGLGLSYVLGGRDDLPLRAASDLLDRFVLGVALDHPVALGGTRRRVPVYGSGGFTANQTPAEAAAVALAHVERGLRAVKVRASGTSCDADMLPAVEAALAGRAALMVDANERCTLATAARLCRAAAAAGALFVEEPLPAAELDGYRALARIAPLPLATGEHLESVAAAAPFLLERLCAVIQPDLAAMGGLTPVLRTAQLAEHVSVEVAPHFLPGLFVHVAAAAPNLTWLEEFPLLEPLFEGWPGVDADGTMIARDVAGHGLRLAEHERERWGIGMIAVERS